ncbi:MAG: hypothetical protein ACK5E6_12840, partial [Cyanobacteriota bacterium]
MQLLTLLAQLPTIWLFPVAAASRRLGAQIPTLAAQQQGMTNRGIVRFEALATPPTAGPRFLHKSFCGDREARIPAALYEAHQAPGPPAAVRCSWRRSAASAGCLSV